MSIIKITLQILRYKPGHIDPPRFQEFTIAADPAASVLDGLEKIRLQQDKTLMYRRSCHHSSCGTCACKINGIERLTCITKIEDLATMKDDFLSLSNQGVQNSIPKLYNLLNIKCVDIQEPRLDYLATMFNNKKEEEKN